MKSKQNIVTIQLSSTVSGDAIDVRGKALEQGRTGWEVNVGEDDWVVLRIDGPSGADDAFTVSSSLNEVEFGPWTRRGRSVESPTITDSGKLELDLTIVGEGGTAKASGSPIIIIHKGGMPDPPPPPPEADESTKD